MYSFFTDDLLALLDVPFLFWVCPFGCDDFVDWKGKTATCRKCGRRSDESDNVEISGSQ